MVEDSSEKTEADTSNMRIHEASIVFLYLLIYAIVFPLMGMMELFIGIILLSCLILVGVSFGRTYSKGNISHNSLDGHKLLWRDAALSEDISYMHIKRNLWVAAIIGGIAMVSLIWSLYFLGGLDYRPEMPLTHELLKGYLDLFALSFLAMILSYSFTLIISINLFMKRKGKMAPGELMVYDSGIRILNRFIPWDELESISRPGHYAYSESLSKIFVFYASLLSYNGLSHVKHPLYKIRDKHGKTFIVPISDVAGLKASLEKAKHKEVMK
jgi:hypothetical protein